MKKKLSFLGAVCRLLSALSPGQCNLNAEQAYLLTQQQTTNN